jgi:hypothetical protein
MKPARRTKKRRKKRKRRKPIPTMSPRLQVANDLLKWTFMHPAPRLHPSVACQFDLFGLRVVRNRQLRLPLPPMLTHMLNCGIPVVFRLSRDHKRKVRLPLRMTTSPACLLNDGSSVINVRGPPTKVLHPVVFPISLSPRPRGTVSGRKCSMLAVNLERISRLRRQLLKPRGIPLSSSSLRLTA